MKRKVGQKVFDCDEQDLSRALGRSNPWAPSPERARLTPIPVWLSKPDIGSGRWKKSAPHWLGRSHAKNECNWGEFAVHPEIGNGTAKTGFWDRKPALNLESIDGRVMSGKVKELPAQRLTGSCWVGSDQWREGEGLVKCCNQYFSPAERPLWWGLERKDYTEVKCPFSYDATKPVIFFFRRSTWIDFFILGIFLLLFKNFFFNFYLLLFYVSIKL